jgi:hypothetical protein
VTFQPDLHGGGEVVVAETVELLYDVAIGQHEELA